MNVFVRPLNKGETFCCSVRKAKEVFKDTEVSLGFAVIRDYAVFMGTKLDTYFNKNVRGRVLATMDLLEGQTSTSIGFYVVKEKSFPTELKQEFEQVYLLKFYEFYQRHANTQSVIRREHIMLVTLLKGELKLYEAVLK